MNTWLMLAAQFVELVLSAPDAPKKFEFKPEPVTVTIPPIPKLPDLPKFEFPAMPAMASGASVPIVAAPAPSLLAQGEAKKGEGTCIPCVPPGAYVFANSSVVCIENVMPKARVLNSIGELSEVKREMHRHYKGELVRVALRYQNVPLTLTPEHPVLAVRLHNCRVSGGGATTMCLPGKENPRCADCAYRREYRPEWVPAGELAATGIAHRCREHAVLVPIWKETVDLPNIDVAAICGESFADVGDGFVIPKKVKAHNAARSVVKVRRLVPLTERFMELCGLFLAEGHVTELRRGRHVIWSFGKDETELAYRTAGILQECFGVAAQMVEKRTSLTVFVSSQLLGGFLRNSFGHGAANKRIPSWILRLPAEKTQAFVRGYWRGDGSRHTKKEAVGFGMSTVSPQIAWGMRVILHRLGIIHSIRYDAGRGEQRIEGRVVHTRPQWSLRVNGPSAVRFSTIVGAPAYKWRYLQSHLAGIDKDYVYLPVKSIERIPYEGDVYNLQTGSTYPSYTVNGVAVHNCSNDHLSTVCGLLGEGLRFARRSGLADPECVRRVSMAEDEINMMERIDMSPASVSALPQDKREIVYWALRGSKSVRDQLKTIKTVEDLEKVAGEACELRLRFRLKAQGIPEDKALQVLQKVVAGTLTAEQGKAELKELRPA